MRQIPEFFPNRTRSRTVEKITIDVAEYNRLKSEVEGLRKSVKHLEGQLRIENVAQERLQSVLYAASRAQHKEAWRSGGYNSDDW